MSQFTTQEANAAVPAPPRAAPMQRTIVGLVAGVVAAALVGAIVSPQSGWPIHLGTGGLWGGLFGLLLGGRLRTAGAALVWGQAFGFLWWLLGPLTVLPLLIGASLPWTAAAMQASISALIGWTLGYGTLLGFFYHGGAVWLFNMAVNTADDATDPPVDVLPPLAQSLIVGGVGGLLGSWIFAWGIDNANFFPLVAGLVRSQSMMVGGLLHYGIGTVIGVTFGLLFPRDLRGPGTGLAWGINYGMVWWLLGPLTLMPLLNGQASTWSLTAVQGAFPSLISHILYGALVGFASGVAARWWQILFVDSDPLNRAQSGAGARGVRNSLMGIGGGVIGGLLFTIVMVGVGMLPNVARLVGGTSMVVGFLVHLLISVIIGISFGLLFQKEIRTYGGGLGWGMLYGLFWWVWGGLTLLPLLLRQTPDWSLAYVSGQYASLVGHLLYGAGLGLFFRYLEQRYAPLRRVRHGVHREPSSVTPPRLDTPATALWAVTLLLGLVLPLLLSI